MTFIFNHCIKSNNDGSGELGVHRLTKLFKASVWGIGRSQANQAIEGLCVGIWPITGYPSYWRPLCGDLAFHRLTKLLKDIWNENVQTFTESFICLRPFPL